jgi:hypothetical protein
VTATAGAPARPDTSDAALRRVSDALAANAERYDRTAEFPWESIHAVHEAGLLTLSIGSAYGGQDLTSTEAARVMQALGRGDPSVALLTAMTVFQHASQSKLPGYGTGSEGLAYHLVGAVTEDDEPLIGHVIVPGDSPGIKHPVRRPRAAGTARQRSSQPHLWCLSGASHVMPEVELQTFRPCEVIGCW